MKWIKSKTKHDHWQFNDSDIIPLEKWSLTDLNAAIDIVEKQAKHREDNLKSIPDGLQHFMRNGILYRYGRGEGGHLTTEEIKVKLPESQMKRLTDWIKLLRHDQIRREVLFIAKLRKVFGNEYYKMEQVRKERETLKDYKAVVAFKDREPDLTDKQIFQKIAAEKGKSWKTVKSNWDYISNNKHKFNEEL